MHIIISVKDFKAIIMHADTMKTNVKAYYSQPTRPLQFSYGCDGLVCEFTLMTSGDYNAAAAPPTPVPAVPAPNRITSRAASVAANVETRENRSMPPPAEPASRQSARRQIGSRPASSPAPPQDDPESLFVNQNEDDDTQWEPLDYNNEEESLGWDASADRTTHNFPTFQDSGSFSRPDGTHSNTDSMEGIAPTQRVSQIKGLW